MKGWERLLNWVSLFHMKFENLKGYFHLFDLLGVRHHYQVIRKPLALTFRKRVVAQMMPLIDLKLYWASILPFQTPKEERLKRRNPLLRARRAFFFLRWFYNLKRHTDFWRISKFLRSRKTQLTTEQFLRFYELRLDLVLYRSGFVPSLYASRMAISCGTVMVNGKIIDSSAHGISGFDTIGFSSSVRLPLKVAFFRQLQRSMFRTIISLARIKLNFFEFNYSIFAFTFVSTFFNTNILPNIHFVFPRPQAFLYWGRTFYIARRRDLWSLTQLQRRY
jgi:hypothetical protein